MFSIDWDRSPCNSDRSLTKTRSCLSDMHQFRPILNQTLVRQLHHRCGAPTEGVAGLGFDSFSAVPGIAVDG